MVEMTQKKVNNNRRPPTRADRTPMRPDTSLNLGRWLLQREVWGLMLTAVGIVTLIALITHDQGKLSDAWSLLLRQAFGLGAYPVAALMTVGGIILLLWNSLQGLFVFRWQAIVGWEMLFFSALGLAHVVSPDMPLQLARAGQGGGYIGWAVWRLMVPLLGRSISLVLLGAVALFGLYLALGLSGVGIIWRLRWIWAQIGLNVRTAILQRRRGPMPRLATNRRPASPPVQRPTSVKRAPAAPPAILAEPETKPNPSPVASPKPARAKKAATTPKTEAAPKAQATPPRVGLPPLDLLVAEERRSEDDTEASQRAQVIEETLEAFGIPARVVEWSRGPVVTQFGVEPGFIERQDREGILRRYKIRVSKILSLANDLALALAAAPIRIEAPVPGRGIVGIEVPNDNKSMVGLRGVLESEAFHKMKGKLRIALGRDVAGQAVVADLAAMPHLLLAGATGSGKSVCLNAIIASLIGFNLPGELKLLLVDPKRVELTKYNGIPHLVSPVVVEIEKVIVALRWVTREMDRRYSEFAQAGARNLTAYNRLARSKGLEPLPMIVLIIDELADLMMAAPDDVERTICRLAQMARATGIHLIIATQRPSVDVVTGLIKANFPARISFAVTSQIDSRVILDVPGAEKLLGRGDMLFMAPDSPKLQRIQGCYVSDKELDALAAFWRDAASAEETPQASLPWDDMSLEKDADDSLIQQAIDLVREHNQASASFLQRQMRIGYPRAARLIDQLEQLGVIGPSEGGGRSRQVLDGGEPQPDGIEPLDLDREGDGG